MFRDRREHGFKHRDAELSGIGIEAGTVIAVTKRQTRRQQVNAPMRESAWRCLDQQGPHRQRFMAKALAESGIFVASIDFRMPPVAPHPASIQDINLGIRWLKANAREFNI